MVNDETRIEHAKLPANSMDKTVIPAGEQAAESVFETRVGAPDTDRATENAGEPDCYVTRMTDTEVIRSPSQPDWPSVDNYEILGELGRGGMGVVYKARQVNLNRLVALKMIRTGPYAGPEELLRFRIEAEAVARLQHPNIVQLFEVKEFHGQAFLALEFIDGSSLARNIETPWSPEQAARLLAALAHAMHYAHEQGIVHRDLKPANILLQMSDLRSRPGHANSTMIVTRTPANPRSAVPKITDFGLAKLMSGDSSGPTVSGDFLGTPAYSAPEQASGHIRDIGPGTDVYALGAVLYELLTGRPPFQGATVLDTLDQVRSQDPVPPSHLQRKLPRDLETICLKCLQKNPQRRYADALLLAEDLENFLQGRPIQARPVSTIERVGKWVRRRPALASLLVVLTLGVIAFGVGGWLSAAAVERQRQRAEDNLTEAIKAVEKMLDEVAGIDLADVPYLEPVRKKLLREARDFYDDFLNKRSEDVTIRYLAGRAKGRLGDIHEMLGENSEAEKSYTEGRDLLEASGADPTDVQVEIARLSNNLGTLLKKLDRLPEAEKNLKEALELRKRLVHDSPENDAYLRDLATSWHDLGTVQARLPKQRAQAQSAYKQALAFQEKLADNHPANANYQRDRVRTLNNLGKLLGPVNKDLAEDKFREAIKIQEKVVQLYPNDPAYRRELARSFNNLANLQVMRDRLPLAEKTFDKALKLLNQLATESPKVPTYRQDLAGTYLNLGVAYQNGKNFAEAYQAYKKALERREQLAKEAPDVPDYQQKLANLHTSLGRLLEQRGLPRKAEEHFERAAELLEKIVGSSDRAEYENDLAAVFDFHGKLVFQRAKQDECLNMATRLLRAAAGMWEIETRPQIKDKLLRSRTLLQRAVVFQRKAMDSDPANTTYRLLLYKLVQRFVALQAFMRDHAGIADSARILAPIYPDRGESYLLAAECFARAIPFAVSDGFLSPEHRQHKVEEYSRAAVEMLEQALSHGFTDLSKLNFKAYDPLRKRPDFRKILERVESGAIRNASLWNIPPQPGLRLFLFSLSFFSPILPGSTTTHGHKAPTICHWLKEPVTRISENVLRRMRATLVSSRGRRG